MKRILFPLTLLVGILLATAVIGSAQPADGVRATPASQVVPGRYIVQLRQEVDPEQTARELAQTHGLTILSVYRHALKGFAARIPSQRVELLREDPSVLTIEPDRVVHAVAQTLPTGVDRMDADLNTLAAIDGVASNVDVDIAVIDTGVDLDHPDINVYHFTDCVDLSLIGPLFGITCIDDDDPLNDGTLGDDLNGHGSHVAGIAAARDNGIGVVGVAPDARIWSVAVLDENGSGFLYWVINGIDYVAAHANEIDVANMSLAWQGNSPAARTAIQNAVAAGVVFVVAAANSSEDIFGPDHTFGTSDDFEPAAYPEVAAIAALADSDGQSGGLGANTNWGPDDTLATFSNFSTASPPGNPVVSPGLGIDVAGPGVSIHSTYKNGTYAILSGTSMASPHVTGAVGLYIAANGRAHTAAEVAFIRQQIINAAQPQTQWGPADTADPDGNREGLAYVGEVEPPPAPSAPTGLTALAASSSRIDLSWTDASDNEDGFEIERCTGVGCSGFTQIATVGAGVTSYSNTGLLADTSYTYRVRAVNAGGASDYSNTDSATTDPPLASPPAAPSNLSATVISSGRGKNKSFSVELTWADNSDNEESFILERCEESGKGRNKTCDFGQLAELAADTTSYVDSNPAKGSYQYRVKARNAQGDSDYSNSVKVNLN